MTHKFMVGDRVMVRGKAPVLEVYAILEGAVSVRPYAGLRELNGAVANSEYLSDLVLAPHDLTEDAAYYGAVTGE